jgi:hypothetical protein
MPKIENWGNLPEGIRQHLIDRMRDRAISIADLNELPSWKRTESSSAKSTHSSRRRILATIGWAIQRVADPRLTTPMVISPNSSPASFCRLSKKAKPSISRMIDFAKWPGSRPRPRSPWPSCLRNEFGLLDVLVNNAGISHAGSRTSRSTLRSRLHRDRPQQLPGHAQRATGRT